MTAVEINSNTAPCVSQRPKSLLEESLILLGSFGDSETSPSSSPNVNSNISPGDTRTDTDHLTRAPTGDYKVDGWWIRGCSSDADHVVIEHRHLFEIVCLVLFLLMALLLCIALLLLPESTAADYG